MKSKLRYTLISVALVGIVLTLANEHRRGQQYYMGMSMSEALAASSGKFPARKFAITYTDQPNEIQKSCDAIYYIYDESEGVFLEFNHYEHLIKKGRIKYFGVNINKIAEYLRAVF